MKITGLKKIKSVSFEIFWETICFIFSPIYDLDTKVYKNIECVRGIYKLYKIRVNGIYLTKR